MISFPSFFKEGRPKAGVVKAVDSELHQATENRLLWKNKLLGRQPNHPGLKATPP